MRAIDVYLINKTQSIYDWLYNEFGIYKGTIQLVFLTIVLLGFFALYLKDGSYLDLFFIVSNLPAVYGCFYTRELQKNEKFNTINSTATLIMHRPSTFCMKIVLLALLFYALLHLMRIQIVMSISVLCYCYCSTIIVKGGNSRVRRSQFAFQ